ncbi:hypothetical protein EDD11_000462 [Mortierella claussenii]|nr:hypothetical protein EDD11_000462 [Mortierella claussenii]
MSLDNELGSDPSDSDNQSSARVSARSSPSAIDSHYYNNLTGPGELSCKLRTKFRCVIGDLDMSEQLMSVRKEMIKQQCTPQLAADLLSLNFIFTRVVLEDNMPPEAAAFLCKQRVVTPRSEDIELLSSCCLNVGTADYQQGRACIKGKPARKASVTCDVLSAYASSGILRSRASDFVINDDTYIEQSMKPLIAGYQERLCPDFYGEKDDLPFILLEIKSSDADPDDCEVAIRKVAMLMKLGLNCLLEAGVEDPVILGLFVRGGRCEVFSMDITYEAIYIQKIVGAFEVPNNKLQLPLLLHALGPLTIVRTMETYDDGQWVFSR